MRCLSLAQALKAAGWQISLLSAGLPAAQRQLWLAEDCPPIDLPRQIGVGSAEDAATTAGCLRELSADALIIDHYRLDAGWEAAANPDRRVSLAIDDPPLRSHVTDWVLDQNLGALPAAAQATRGASLSAHLQGPSYALLRPEFSKVRAGLQRQCGRVRRLLVNLGGYDPQGYTWPVVQQTTERLGKDVYIDVVVGPGNPDQAALQAWAASANGRSVTVQANDMAARMAAADLAIGAGGSSAWERCCLGLPSLTAVLADNQRELVRMGAQAGVMREGGDLRSPAGLQQLDRALQDGLDDEPGRMAMAAAAMALVDGQGAARVAATLTAAIRNLTP